MKAFFKWATTPPQAYAVYVLLVVAIGALSFYAGTLKQKPVHGLSPGALVQPNR